MEDNKENPQGGPDAVQEQKIITKMYLDYLTDLLSLCSENDINTETPLAEIEKKNNELKTRFLESFTRDQFLDIIEEVHIVIKNTVGSLVKELLDRTQEIEEQVLDQSEMGLDLSDCKLTLGNILEAISEIGDESMPPLKVLTQAFVDLKRVTSISEEKNQEYNNIVMEISKAEKAVLELQNSGIDSNQVEKILDNANIALLTENFKSALEQAELAREMAKKMLEEGPTEIAEEDDSIQLSDEEVQRMIPQIEALSLEISEKLELLQRSGMEISQVKRQYMAAKKAIDAGDHKKAVTGLMTIKMALDNVFYQEVNRIVRVTADTIRQAPPYIILTEPMNSLNEASQLIIENEYVQAFHKAIQSQEMVTTLKEEYQSILKIIQLCEVKVKALKKENIDLSNFEYPLAAAKEALRVGDYKSAIDKANEALLQIEESKRPIMERYKRQVGDTVERTKPMVAELEEQGLDINDINRVKDELDAQVEEASTMEDYKQILDIVYALRAEVARTIRRSEYLDNKAKSKYGPLKEKLDKMFVDMSIPSAKRSLDVIQEAMVNNKPGVISAEITKIENLLQEAHDSYYPEFSIEINGNEFSTERSVNMNLSIMNFGYANAREVQVDVSGELTTTEKPYPVDLKYGESYTIPIGIKFGKALDPLVIVTIKAKRSYDMAEIVVKGRGKVFKDKTGKFTTSSIPLDLVGRDKPQVELEIDWESDEEEPVVQAGATCAGCLQTLSEEAPKVTCSCSAPYHVKCFGELSNCIVCGTVLKNDPRDE